MASVPEGDGVAFVRLFILWFYVCFAKISRHTRARTRNVIFPHCCGDFKNVGKHMLLDTTAFAFGNDK
uniref:Putative secreted protein n=1 Tax=Anopheles darlingi TaxID=43151 RepID=A0A2M4D6C1_ANODA